jgi:H3 lysine-79-specific histone-lysine N-methyltransferase
MANKQIFDLGLAHNYSCFNVFQVYGETSYELVDQMIKSVNFTEDDFFIDLGSGKSFKKRYFSLASQMAV